MKDELTFTLSATFHGTSESEPILDPTINGQSLIEMVRQVELPFMPRRPDLAGDYSGIPARLALLPSRHLLGGSPEKSIILVCTCGEPGCGALFANIEVTEGEVVWSKFSGIRRPAPGRSGWHDALGPFRFDKQQYLEALQILPTLKSPAPERQRREQGEYRRREAQEKAHALAEARVPWRSLAERIRNLPRLLPQQLDQVPGRSLNLFNLWLQEHEGAPDGRALFGALETLLRLGQNNECSEEFWVEMLAVGEQFMASPPTRAL